MATQAQSQAKAEHLPPFLAAIDLATYTGDGQIDHAKELAYTGGLFAQATAATLDQAFALLKETVARIPIYLDVSALEEQQDVVDLLDAGAAKVFVSSTQLSQSFPTSTQADSSSARPEMPAPSSTEPHTPSTSTSQTPALSAAC
jgi:hypothetical protein